MKNLLRNKWLLIIGGTIVLAGLIIGVGTDWVKKPPLSPSTEKGPAVKKVSKEKEGRKVVSTSQQEPTGTVRKVDKIQDIIGCPNYPVEGTLEEKLDALSVCLGGKPSKEKKTQEVKTYKIGDKIEMRDVTFTVHSFEEYTRNGQAIPLPEGKKPMAVEISCKNTSGKELDIFSLPIHGFYLRYRTSYGYKRAFSSAVTKKPELPHSGTLASGKSIKGFKTYSVPQDASGFQYVYKSFSGEIKVKIDLGK